jgi:hypothetical protein
MEMMWDTYRQKGCAPVDEDEQCDCHNQQKANMDCKSWCSLESNDKQIHQGSDAPQKRGIQQQDSRFLWESTMLGQVLNDV